MTLNGLNDHFTLYVHYYEMPLTHYLLLIYCSVFITRATNACDQRRSAGSGIANSGPQNMESTENLWIFPGRYIVGTLTNNANITIYYIVLLNALSPFQ